MTSYSENFTANFKILKFFGLWTLETDSLLKKRLYSLYQRFLPSLIMLFAIQQYIDLYIVRHEFEKFNINFCLTAEVTLVFFKILRFTQIIPGVRALREKLNKNAKEEYDVEFKKILSIASSEIKILNLLLHATGCIFSVMLWMVPLFLFHQSGIKNLPARQWFPFDIQVSPNYESAFLYQVLFTFPVTMIPTDVDLSVIGFMISLSAEYEILKRNVERKFNEIYKDENVDPSVADAKTLEVIRDLAVRHQEITGQVH